MPNMKRQKTKYPGVTYIVGKNSSGRSEKIFYVRYRKNGKQTEEKVGRQYQDDMTPARASRIRADRQEGKELDNTQRRTEASKTAWTVDRLSVEYFAQRVDGKGKETDQGRYENYLQKTFGKLEPAEIDPLSTDRLRVKLLKTKSPQTVKHILSLLTWITNFGKQKRLCPGLSFDIKHPVVDNQKTEDLSPDHLRRLLQELDSTSFVTAAKMMKLALFTGMRRGEIFKLKWDDVKFDRGLIDIVDPKGGKNQRIPLNENTRGVLESIPEVSEYVFPARGGGPRKSANRDFNEIKKAAGLPKDFRAMHGLRHVFATYIASSGEVDMLALQKMLTHKDPRMTQRYIHYHETALQRAGNKVDEIFSEALKPDQKKKKTA